MMHAHVVSVRAYAVVLAILIALTVATIGISFLPLSGGWHIAAGLGIGVVKASLVALIFMHVITSPRLTWIVILIALLWLALLFGLTFCDYATRGMIPALPGH
jgi:cytochrome c oxidase subunit 4